MNQKIISILKNREIVVDIISTLFLLFLQIGLYYVHIGGRDIPLELDLNYTSGILKTVEVAKDHKNRPIKHIRIHDIKKNQYITISCGDHVFPKYLLTDCSYLDKYNNRSVTVGWYKQNDILWFSNDIPQMAVFDVDGVGRVVSYDTTIAGARFDNRLFFLAIFFGNIYFLVALYKGFNRDLSEKNKDINLKV